MKFCHESLALITGFRLFWLAASQNCWNQVCSWL